MKFIVFETINLDNGKIYVGIHRVNDPEVFDGYLGDGVDIHLPESYNKSKTQLQSAVQRHGINAFKRITLKEFNNINDATDFYMLIVNEDFIKRTDNYNSIASPSICRRQRVNAFTFSGGHVGKWDSIDEAADDLHVSKEHVIICINTRTNCKNVYLSFDESIDVDLYSNMPRGAIAQYNRDGVLINTYRDIPSAAAQLDIPKDAVARAVSMRATCSGYRFMRISEDIRKVLGKKSAIELTTTVPVYRYTLRGEFDAAFDSIKEAAKGTPNISTGKIIRAIKMNRACRGYKWSYDKMDKWIATNAPVARKVEQYDLKGNLVKLYSSTKELTEEQIRILRKPMVSDPYILKYKKMS